MSGEQYVNMFIVWENLYSQDNGQYNASKVQEHLDSQWQ